MPEEYKFKPKPALGFKRKDGTVVKEEPSEFRKYAAMFVRGVSGFTPGGPIGFAAGTVGEGVAQTIEGRDEYNYPSMAAAGVLNTIPFGSTASVGRALIKGGMLGGVGTALQQQTEEGLHIPTKEDIKGIAIGTTLGGAGGGVSSKIQNRFGIGRPPTEMPNVVPPKANITNIAAEGMTGNREVIPVKSTTSVLPTRTQAGDKIRKAKGTLPRTAERIRTSDPSEGRRIMEEIAGKRQGLDSEIGAIGDIDSVRAKIPRVEGQPIASDNWQARVDELDKIGARDIEYRDILSTGSKTSLKRGETWRGKILKYIEWDKAKYEPIASPRKGIMDETGALNITLPKMPNIHLPKEFGVTDVVNAPKAIGASLDVSFPGRQGLWMIGRKEWRKSWAPMINSLRSEKAYRKLQDSITNHPKFVEAVNNGLQLTDFAGVQVPKGMKTKAIGRLAQQEEQFGTRLVEQFTGGKYSPFRASNRAYSAFANNLRMSMYDNLTDKANRIAQRGGDIADRKKLAEYINSGSGRGSMGITVGGKSETLEKGADLLNTIFWSPRFLASRVQLLNVPGNLIKMDKFTRQEYLRDLITSVTAGGTILGIANLAGADVNMNPLEADFMKAKINNTRVDLTGGFSPLIRFISQGVNGVLDLSEKEADGPNPWKFIESKLSPGARFLKEAGFGKDYFERDISLGGAALNMITPMIARDFYEIWKNDPKLFPLGGIALVGGSVQSYKQRNRGRKMPGDNISLPKMPKMPSIMN